MVVMSRKDIAAVVPAAKHLGYNVLRFVCFQELILNVQLYALHALYRLGCYPHYRFINDAMPIGLKELDRRGPGIDESRIGALTSLLQP